jgi:hypothetical protein
MHGCIAAYVEAEIEKRGMRKRVQRLRSLRKTGEAFETTFRLLEDCESALAIEEKEEEGGVVVQFWTTREAMQALSVALDAQSAAITDAIGRQARMVAEASDLAETQLREAEAARGARGVCGGAARAAARVSPQHARAAASTTSADSCSCS